MEHNSKEGHIHCSSQTVFLDDHKKKTQRLKLARCMKCGGSNPFRLDPMAYNIWQSHANAMVVESLFS